MTNPESGEPPSPSSSPGTLLQRASPRKWIWMIVGLAVAGFAAALLVARFTSGQQSSSGTASTQKTYQPAEIQALITKAGGGNVEAQSILGQIYAQGLGVRQDFAEAVKWYRQAAQRGNADAENTLAELYDAGQGVPHDVAEAVKWYRLAADHGHVGGQFNLAVSYQSGRGVPKNQEEAAKWYRRAAEQGDAQAEYNLGQRYDLAVGVPADRVEAYKWLSLAAANGIPDAASHRDKLAGQMTPEQIAEGKRRTIAFVSQKGAPKP